MKTLRLFSDFVTISFPFVIIVVAIVGLLVDEFTFFEFWVLLLLVEILGEVKK